MLLKTIKTVVLIMLTACVLNAGQFNLQAEKDRMALIKYMETKFKDAPKNKNQFFPYSTIKELKKFKKAPKHNDFGAGTYAFDKIGKMSRDDQMEMPPFDDNVEEGEKLFKKYFTKCFKANTANQYPMFDEFKGKVVTLSGALMTCAKKAGLDKLKNKKGKKVWNMKKGKMAHVQAYLMNMAAENDKKIDISINSAKAALAYEDGKKGYYSQRGYLKLSCATCHVQGAGQRVRLQLMSPLLGHVTHFPVYRVGKGKMFTLEGRLGGCNRDEGEKPHKPGSTWSNNVLYFMSYMSNGMNIALDVRR
ncbi:sulfur oxidation protein SoxA [hydrothermal vent metagenome]|uniref:Sulfur oxidation protein SoxA n=1 Tax=hydrothermal vent metagenome TaxID=652676 RepID=A0A3B1E9D6_9ZZZZ